ncbi:HAMP domain-containing sensor histidine kinase [Clostridium celatum]|uniref:sensor histidine kinase n=1 Tax=Clostridium celatum TaxID=36834 RepID=UPI0018988A55|nr:sensor histidine kinase [Clostridium celatum]MCE9655291.1 sensor histidine kinase [Clostridium celatum]MDU2265493.1 sensor histidine kinase [Clostridium celatum]MDU3724397.1 sensor histidine kinase [Clostridium celatum]MDU6295223.1 sensor histidine kinase [Clostridium celatum]
MSFLEYLEEKYIFIAINLIALIISFFILLGLNVDNYAVIFICILNFLASSSFYFYDYFNKRKYYKNLLDKLEGLDKKYFIADVASEGDFLDSKIFYEVLEQATKSMKDDISDAIRDSADYKEYIELWVHEIKTPIATCKLLIENNENEITESIGEEVTKIDNYIEQVLFYARSNTVEKDYLIKKINLKDSINSVIRRNATSLIEKKVKIDIKNVDKIVFCDSKWIEFILGQIISNSIKYMDKSNSILKIYSEDIGNDVILKICDNGIGMDEKDVIKAFEKGYTGKNGRRFGKTTGMGLYLCKKMCEKLGLSVNIKSRENEGTEVSILFPVNDMMKF